MADNVTTPIPNGVILAADEIAGVVYPRTKLSVGADGVAVDVSAAAPMPVTAATLPLPTGAATAAAQATILAKLIAAPATEAKQDTTITAINGLVGNEYEIVAASAADQILGTTGAIGDLIVGLLVTPGTTSPGPVSIKDGSGGSPITVFVGGASSVSTLHPFFVPLNIKATSVGWRVTTGTNVTAIGVGNFT